jgi:hypothetical protein
MREVNPTTYFDECHLRESLVLLFAFESGERALDLVISYAAEAASQAFEAQLKGLSIEQIEPMPRDMRHFRFEDAVVSIKSSGAKSFDLTTLEEYLNYRPRTIEGVVHGHSNESFQLEIEIGGVGAITTVYEKLLVESRKLVGRASGPKTWVYHDLITGDMVDFYNPFPGIKVDRSHSRTSPFQ